MPPLVLCPSAAYEKGGAKGDLAWCGLEPLWLPFGSSLQSERELACENFGDLQSAVPQSRLSEQASGLDWCPRGCASGGRRRQLAKTCPALIL